MWIGQPLFRKMPWPVVRAFPWLLLVRWAACQTIHEHLGAAIDRVPCTIDDLLPWGQDDEFRSGWSRTVIDSLPYDCSCPTTKARYFCPSLGNRKYPMWKPPAVRKGKCTVVDRDELAKEALPPNAKVLFYGNSHMRQMVEGLVCMYWHQLESRRMRITSEDEPSRDVLAALDAQCRACGGPVMQPLVNASCIKPGATSGACSCNDDTAQFNFKNGASVHYYFAHQEDNKNLDDALAAHGTTFGDYNMIFVNLGNKPKMEEGVVLSSAESCRKNGVAFVWLTTYEAFGKPETFFSSMGKLEQFVSLGVRYVPIHEIVKQVKRFKKGNVEGVNDYHFCLPGPTNEVSLFLLQLVWSTRVGS